MTANNPTQTQTQSQQGLRTDLRAILNAAKERRHELAAGTGQQVTSILNKADGFDDAIQRPQEEVIASEIFALAAGSALVVAKKLAQGGRSFNPADFVRRLKAHYVAETDAQEAGAADPSAFAWAAVGRRLAGWLRPAPAVYHMVGPMAAAPKAKRPAAQRRKRGPVAEVVRPDEVAQAGEDKQETDRNMETMWGVLRGRPDGAAPLLELVLNHDSFSQTVENLFTLSFLVRDGKVELKEGAGGEGVVVRHLVGRQHKKRGGGGEGDGGGGKADAERVQFVMTLDFDEWEEWQKVVPRGTTLMPHRDHHSLRDDGGGDGSGGAAEEPQGTQRQEGEEEEEEGEAPRKGGRKQRRRAAAEESEEEEEDEGAAGPSNAAARPKRRKSS